MLSRRKFVAGSVALASTWELQRAARALGVGQEAAVCRLAAEQTVGPYYLPDELVRSAIAEDKPGLPLDLRLTLLDARTCKPLRDVAVETWHCDASGLYSGFTKMDPTGFGPGGPGGRGGPSPGFPSGPPPGKDPQHPGNRPGPPEVWARRRR